MGQGGGQVAPPWEDAGGGDEGRGGERGVRLGLGDEGERELGFACLYTPSQ